jgi:hypothetical protein
LISSVCTLNPMVYLTLGALPLLNSINLWMWGTKTGTWGWLPVYGFVIAEWLCWCPSCSQGLHKKNFSVFGGSLPNLLFYCVVMHVLSEVWAQTRLDCPQFMWSTEMLYLCTLSLLGLHRFKDFET